MITQIRGLWTGTADVKTNTLNIFLIFITLFLVGCSISGNSISLDGDNSHPEIQISEGSTAEVNSDKTKTVEEINSVLPEPAVQTTVLPTETPSPTPAPLLYRLSEGSCCVDHFWSPDGNQILFVDRPAPEAQSGLWAVDINGGAAQFVTDRLGIFSPDMQLRAFPSNGQTIIERLSTGEQWVVPNDGRAVSFSPDGNQIAWTAGQSGPPFDRTQRQVWVSQFDGSQPLKVFTATGGGFEGWFPDGRLLVSERNADTNGEQVFWVFSLDENPGIQPSLTELGRAGRLRQAIISPNGSWLVYLATFSENSEQDGIWLVNSRTGERKRLEVFGDYLWQDDQHLLMVPLDLSQQVHRIVQIEAVSGQVTPITDPAVTPIKIAQGDWSVSPDGTKIAFLSAADSNIWVLKLLETQE